MSMKRAQSLVDYASSDDDDDSEPVSPPPAKRKKLPALASTLTVPRPVDNPALHQGRTRGTPHVDGQWAAHVYVSLKLSTKSALWELLRDAITTARQNISALHDFWQDTASKEVELHVSLSRPIFLRAHQREELKCAVKALAAAIVPFTISFASFTSLVNDERTRTFLAVEVGAGHDQLNALSTGLTPLLRQFRQKAYYEEPRFHASFAWALLSATDNTHELSSTLVSSLNDKFRSKLSSKINFFEAERVEVKIGKEVSGWRLKGSVISCP